jgi:hypothetical protein
MPALQTAARRTEFKRRGAGTDAERRSAVWLAGEVRVSRRDVAVDPFWCRPNWALAHSWHTALAIGGSLLVVAHARLGGALLLVALISVLGDRLTGHSIGRRLTPERASQNVVSPPPGRPPSPNGGQADDGQADPMKSRTRLIVTANYDAGRMGLVYRDGLRAVSAGLKRIAGNGRLTPGWMGWLVIELLWLLAVAVLRAGGSGGTALGVIQLVPTAALVIELGALLELSLAPFGPAAGDNASGTAVALALVRALDVAPPRHLGVELVLQGAGENGMVGLRHHLRATADRRPAATIVLGIGPCGAGYPCWWISDGSLVPLRYSARLRRLAARTGGSGGQVGTTAHRGRGSSPALPARARGVPALTIGCVDPHGLVPRSHQAGDVAAALEPGALDALLQYALMLVDAFDADVAAATDRSGAARAAA